MASVLQNLNVITVYLAVFYLAVFILLSIT